MLSSSGPTGGPLGSLLGHVGGILGRLETLLGLFRAISGRLGGIFGHFGGIGGLPRLSWKLWSADPFFTRDRGLGSPDPQFFSK